MGVLILLPFYTLMLVLEIELQGKEERELAFVASVNNSLMRCTFLLFVLKWKTTDF